MKKVLSYSGRVIAVLGFILMLGAVGIIERNTGTWSQFWITLLHSVGMMSVGMILTIRFDHN
jgi:hypothetical protein